MDIPSAFRALAIAAGLGLLVGIQRERAGAEMAGMRTFPLITMLGAMCAMMSAQAGGWVVAAGFLALAALLVFVNMARLQLGVGDTGLTTEVAVLVMYGVGALLVFGPEAVAIAAGAGVAALLQFKAPMHGFAARLGDKDLKAIMQFALLSLVILPVLPDRTFGPYNVLNPKQTWLMVVLIVGIGLGGYIVHKFMGEKRGEFLSGILGGLISSTATTATYARRTAEAEPAHGRAAVILTIASAVAGVRMMAEVQVVAPQFLRAAAGPLIAVPAVLVMLSVAVWLREGRRGRSHAPEQQNPSELKPALIFGALYAVVLVAVAAAREHVGSSGMYVVAVLSGLTDMDAITLSTARLVGTDRLAVDAGWRAIVSALLANLAFKTGMVWVMGHRRLALGIAAVNGVAIAAGIGVLAAWPG
jgi:uncharacterized membrane protein (DUF4010 family)